LPDGGFVFKPKNPNLGNFWSAFRLENVNNIFYGQLEYFTEIWEMLWQFGTFFIH
jgi:hypothetical protein